MKVPMIRWILFLLISVTISCSQQEKSDPKEFQILKEAYLTGHLTVVRSILEEKFKESDLNPKETILYLKTLFYLKAWNEFLNVWKQSEFKSPELILLYYKVYLLGGQDSNQKDEELGHLLDLIIVSPEAMLLYLRLQNYQISHSEKKLFLAQVKGFRNSLDVLQKELETKK